MDIRTTSPEEYARWLTSIGVQPVERVSRDLILAITSDLKKIGVPEGFEQLSADAEKLIADNYTARIKAGLT